MVEVEIGDLVFVEGRKPEYGRNTLGARRELTTHLCTGLESNSGHNSGKLAL